jgi:beta-glucosidase/6-phospho-beta-glucosidase/beta-galactosidase
VVQYEGANATDGKGPSIWDAFEAVPGNVFQNQTGESSMQLCHVTESVPST